MNHKLSLAILLFLLFFIGVHLAKPAFAYTEEGAFRDFGLGYSDKTVVPIWVVAILLAILCYLSIYYLAVNAD